MSTKPKPQPTELDHIRDTLTGVLDLVGETRQDVKQLDNKVGQLDNKVGQLDNKVEQLDNKFEQGFSEVKQEQAETRKDIARLELLIRQLIPNANN